MPIIPIVIDDSTDKVITGQISYDRASGGKLIIPSASTHPTSPVAKEIYWNTTTNKFYRRNDGNTDWVEVYDLRRSDRVYQFYDFIGKNIDSDVWSFAAAAGASISIDMSQPYGEIVFDGSANGDWIVFVSGTGASYMINVADNFDISFRFKITTNGNQPGVGLIYDGNNFIKMYSTAGSNWKTITKNAGSSTENTTDVAIDTDYHTLRITSTASEVKFYIDDVLKETHTTNIPTADLFLEVRLDLLGDGQDYAYLDWIEYMIDRP